MRIRLAAFVAVFVLTGGAGGLAPTAFAGTQKVTICHVPAGEPRNGHEIVVGEKALAAHLENHPGDRVGSCRDVCTSAGQCDDANPCTVDICSGDGTCNNSQPTDCGDGNVCTLDACDPESGCVNPPVPDEDRVACEDNDACSLGDVCKGGICRGVSEEGCCVSDADCPPSDACSVRFCDDGSGTCSEVDISSKCTAGPCQVAFCDPGTGCGTVPVTCPDDGDICTVAECNPEICGVGGGCETFPNPNPPPGACCGAQSTPTGSCPVQCTGGCTEDTCRVDCSGDSACEGQAIACPAGWSCQLTCAGVGACEDVTLNCSAEDLCALDCDYSSAQDVCKNAAVNCGSNYCRQVCDVIPASGFGPIPLDCTGACCEDSCHRSGNP